MTTCLTSAAAAVGTRTQSVGIGRSAMGTVTGAATGVLPAPVGMGPGDAAISATPSGCRTSSGSASTTRGYPRPA